MAPTDGSPGSTPSSGTAGKNWVKPALAGVALCVAVAGTTAGLVYGVYRKDNMRVGPDLDASMGRRGLQCGPKHWDYGVNSSGREPTPLALLRDPDTKFPDGFVWGTATASYQVEGAVKEGGRGASIWDKFSHTKGKVEDNANGDVACDHYHRFKSDVALLKFLGIPSYRFSIAWPRIIPNGEGEVNEAGVKWYSDLVDELLANNITPAVTLYHWDLPQALEDKHKGWLGEATVDAYAKYVDVVFDRLGDRVKFWITFNEPWCTSVLGYGIGAHAPGRKDLKRNPYIVAHHQLLAHAKAVKLYRTKYQEKQGGKIGITLNADFKQAACNTTMDKDAAERSLVHHLAWFADPVFKGDYPDEMKQSVGKRLPTFTDQQKADLKGSADYFGLNSYTTALVLNPMYAPTGNYFSDARTSLLSDPKWPRGESSWLYDVPWGLRRLLNWIKDRYDNPGIYVTENGASGPKEGKMTDLQSLNDTFRQHFITGYISEMYKAIAVDGVDVKGYYVWSLMDNFEWADGYRPRFGIVRVNFTSQERIPKGSALLYSSIVRRFSEGGGDSAISNDPIGDGTNPNVTSPSAHMLNPAPGYRQSLDVQANGKLLRS